MGLRIGSASLPCVGALLLPKWPVERHDPVGVGQAAPLLRQVNLRVDQKLEAGLVCQDGSWLYPIIDDIPILLSDEAITLDQLDAQDKPGE